LEESDNIETVLTNTSSYISFASIYRFSICVWTVPYHLVSSTRQAITDISPENEKWSGIQ